MRVVFTQASRHDLRKIARHIKAYDPKRALLVVDDLREKAIEIGDFPKRFQVLSSRPGSGLRRRVVGRYLILYRIRNDVVVINRVFHGAQDVRLFPAGD